MFGIGYLCMGKYGLAVPAIILSVASGKLMIDKMPREDREQIPCSDSVTQERPFQS